MTDTEEKVLEGSSSLPEEDRANRTLKDIKKFDVVYDGSFETYIHCILYPARGRPLCEIIKFYEGVSISSFDMLKLIIIITKYLREEVFNRHLLAVKEIAFKWIVLQKHFTKQKMQLNILMMDIITLRASCTMITDKLNKAVVKHNEIKQRIHAIHQNLNKSSVQIYDYKVVDCLNKYMKNVGAIQKELTVLFCKTSRLYRQMTEKMNTSIQPAHYLSEYKEAAIKETLKKMETGIGDLIKRVKNLKCKLNYYHIQQLNKLHTC